MSRGHSYAQIPVSEAREDDSTAHDASASRTPLSLLSNLPRLPSSSSRYSRVENEQLEEVDEDEAGVMLTLMRRPADSEITIDPSIQAGSSSSSSSAAGPSSGAAAVTGARGAAGAGSSSSSMPHFPVAAGAKRMIQKTMDGVFSNLSAKPRVEAPQQEELPPPYKSAALDQTPAYYEATVTTPGYSDDDVLVDGLPVGGYVGFIWNMTISMSFQFVGFFLTYILHTSHATKNGSKMGLGITFVSMGMQMMTGKIEVEEPDENSDTGYMGNVGEDLKSVKEYMWLSYFMVILGASIMLQSLMEFARAKRTEKAINAASSQQAGETELTSESAV
ncbi:hypothetical protein BGZ99_006385 [Dissophora globulifera]|uniref:Uncharacterized protein n=1 Tax=Dissophora globulifera TaxID=979702 RepID=A0A9P6RX11_9FUNG|nr:hypothetical protein BGZ99_006385 [Dissophora globulifera]